MGKELSRFTAAYAITSGSGRPAWVNPALSACSGYSFVESELAGSTFDGGLYRLHDAFTGPLALGAIRAAFPEYGSRATPFGFDWMGRHFAIDSERRADGDEPAVLLLEPGSGDVYEIPAAFAGFHDSELVDYPEPSLSVELFEQWRTKAEDADRLALEECVGYVVPLFLGGSNAVGNLEKADTDVYWHLSAQLLQGTREAPPRSKITGVFKRRSGG